MKLSGPGNRRTFSAEDEAYVLARAYVPEHIPRLMALISTGQPFLVEDYLGLVKDNWLILVGYPLEEQFFPERRQQVVTQVLEAYRPEYLWFIGPGIPPDLAGACRERKTDHYLRLDLRENEVKSSLRRVVRKAAESLTVDTSRRFTKEHRALAAEFMALQTLPPMVRELYQAMPAYIAHSPHACLLSARDETGRLSAFYVVDSAAKQFDTYLLGCYSRKNYVPHASDLLFQAMIELAEEHGKKVINLGLGVNEGISRFKKKWGGIPFLKYEFCECYYPRPQIRAVVDMLLGGKP